MGKPGTLFRGNAGPACAGQVACSSCAEGIKPEPSPLPLAPGAVPPVSCVLTPGDLWTSGLLLHDVFRLTRQALRSPRCIPASSLKSSGSSRYPDPAVGRRYMSAYKGHAAAAGNWIQHAHGQLSSSAAHPPVGMTAQSAALAACYARTNRSQAVMLGTSRHCQASTGAKHPALWGHSTPSAWRLRASCLCAPPCVHVPCDLQTDTRWASSLAHQGPAHDLPLATVPDEAVCSCCILSSNRIGLWHTACTLIEASITLAVQVSMRRGRALQNALALGNTDLVGAARRRNGFSSAIQRGKASCCC